MSKKAKVQILYVLAVLIFFICFFFYNTTPTLMQSFEKEVKKADIDQKYKVVEVPNSKYILVITEVPHSIWYYKNTEIFGRNFGEFVSNDNVYSRINKGFDHPMDSKFGLIEDGVQRKSNRLSKGDYGYLHLGGYFEDSKFAYLYKDLVFYYEN